MSPSRPGISSAHKHAPDGEGARVVDYDTVAPVYDQRYTQQRYEGIRACLVRFIEHAHGPIIEVGCGTGQWLAALSSSRATLVAGIDMSHGMLAEAAARAPRAGLVRGTALQLPFSSGSCDRLFCINALHHFPDHRAFLREALRVLRPNGGLLSIGLDPHIAADAWWIYEYFPSARTADAARFPSTADVRSQLVAAGFSAVQTIVAEHIQGEASCEVAQAQGLLDRRSTSQLMVISDDEYAAGLRHIEAERPTLRASLHLYATTAWKGARVDP